MIDTTVVDFLRCIEKKMEPSRCSQSRNVQYVPFADPCHGVMSAPYASPVDEKAARHFFVESTDRTKRELALDVFAYFERGRGRIPRGYWCSTIEQLKCCLRRNLFLGLELGNLRSLG